MGQSGNKSKQNTHTHTHFMKNLGTDQIAKPRYTPRKSRKIKGTGQILKTANLI